MGVERPEARPAELDAGEAADDERRRRYWRAVRRVPGVVLIGPQRVDVADAARELGDGDPRRQFMFTEGSIRRTEPAFAAIEAIISPVMTACAITASGSVTAMALP